MVFCCFAELADPTLDNDIVKESKQVKTKAIEIIPEPVDVFDPNIVSGT